MGITTDHSSIPINATVFTHMDAPFDLFSAKAFPSSFDLSVAVVSLISFISSMSFPFLTSGSYMRLSPPYPSRIYPLPKTTLRYLGSAGSISIFSLMCLI